MYPMMKFYLLLAFIFSYNYTFSQTLAKEYVVSGNQYYKEMQFDKAELQYRQALSVDASSIKANYNLGNTLYELNRLDEARAHYDKILHNPYSKKEDKHKALYNIGRSYLDQKEPLKALKALKEALKLNPNDDETRYNFALARKMLEEQQNQNPNNSEDKNDQGKNQRSEQREQDSSPQGDENQQENQQGSHNDQGENGNNQGSGDQPKDTQITQGSDEKGQESPNAVNQEHQNAILKALEQQEQETFKRVISQKAKKVRTNTEKDW